MTDKSVDIGGSDLFSLGTTQFHVQTSNSPHGRDASGMLDASGNNECETMINNMTNYSANYAYCNETSDIKTDLGTSLTAFGTVLDSKLPTALNIQFAFGEYATLDYTGHNHDDNEHVTTVCGIADVSDAVPASAGFGVPDFGLTVGDNATPISASISVSYNHIDAPGADGEHWVGTNTTFRAEMSLELLGIPTSITVAAIETDLSGWTVDTNGGNDGNQELDHFTITAHRFFDLTAA